MTYPFPPDVRELIDFRMATGSYASEDDLLKEALQTLPGEDDLAAIRDGLDLLDQGDSGVPLEEAFLTIRQKHGISPSA